MRPKKSYGQNFLVDETVSQRIVDSFLKIQDCDNVLEVGPGKGALTKYLQKVDGINFKAVEADWDMIHYLQQNLNLDESQLIQKDFLQLPLEQTFTNEPFDIIGNFPYNISSQILFRVLKYRDCVPTVVGMFQKEVAERIASDSGSKVYGVISVLIQAFYEAKILFRVNPGSFFPAPKVKSAIICLQRKEDFSLPCDYKLFRRIVKTSFNQRRKMLRNTLKPLIKNPEMLSLDIMTQRPEQLSVESFFNLTNLIQENNI